MNNSKYISLGLLAQETGLPKAVLRRYAEARRIPVLRTTRRWMFKLAAVEAALDKIARGSGDVR